eukprot:4305155-Amphidinium_carterae.1
MEWFSFFKSGKCPPKKCCAIHLTCLHARLGHLKDRPKMGVCQHARDGRIVSRELLVAMTPNLPRLRNY